MKQGSGPKAPKRTPAQMWEYLEAHLATDSIYDIIGTKAGTGYSWNIKNGFSDMSEKKLGRLTGLYELVYSWWGEDLFAGVDLPAIDENDPGHRDPYDMTRPERAHQAHRMAEEVMTKRGWTDKIMADKLGYETVGGFRTFRKNPTQNMSCAKYGRLVELHKAL